MAAGQLIYEIIVKAPGLPIVKEFKKGLKDLENTALQFFKKLPELSIEALVSSAREWMKYEDALSQARRTMNLTRAETEALGKELIDMSLNLLQGRTSFFALAEIAGQAGQLGIARDELEHFVPAVAMMSEAFGMASGTTAEFMGIIMNLFNIPVENILGIGSAITELGNTTLATAGQILEIMRRMGGMAAVFGLTAEQTAGLAAQLRNMGVTTRIAGSAMTRLMGSMLQQHEKFAEVLKINTALFRSMLESSPDEALFLVLDRIKSIQQTEGKIGMLEALRELGITSVETADSVLKLAQDTDGLRKQMEKSTKASEEGDAAQKAYNAAVDTASGQWKEFYENLRLTQLLIGGPLAKAAGWFVETVLTPLVKQINAWLKTAGNQKSLLDVLLEGFSALGLAVLAVWKYIRGWLKVLGEEGIEGVWKRIKTASQEALDWIMENGGAAWDWVKEVVTDMGKIIDALIDLIDWVKVLINDLKDIGNIWDDFYSSTLADLKSLGGAWAEYLINPIKAAHDMGTKLGKMLYGDSVLPDTITWLGKTGAAVDSVSSKLHEMLQMGGAFIGSAALIPGDSTRFAMSSEALIRASKLSQRPMVAETRAQERQVMPEEIVLVMEKHEIGRFTSVITKEQEGLGKFTFKVNP